MNEVLNMGMQDRDRLHIIRNTLTHRFTQMEAANQLGVSYRQVQRICAAVRRRGDRGILHGLCGQPSNNRLDPEVLGQALSAMHNPRWHGFGPIFCVDKLEDFYDLSLSEGTVRRLMILTNLWEPHHRGRRHRAWRERRLCVGMLIQLDGSDHDWFEGRGPRCVLIIYIDDATSRILYGEFVHVEDTLTLMRTTKTYLTRWGRPVDFYVDKDSIYKVNRQATVEEDLRDEQPLTQFTRAMRQLGIGVIAANSPQAKGRVERGFLTHQDRLVKELRLAAISTMDEANQFLWKVYIPEHNRRCAIDPVGPLDVHKPLLPGHDLAAILSIQIERQVHNDFTIRHRNHFLQLQEKQPVRLYRKARVTVQERLDGSMHIVFKDRRLLFHSIQGRPLTPVQPKKYRATPASAAKPKRCPHRSPPINYAALNAARRVPMNPPASAMLQ